MITNFSLDSFSITDTRSRHEDTDFATVSITVGTNAAITGRGGQGSVSRQHTDAVVVVVRNKEVARTIRSH